MTANTLAFPGAQWERVAPADAGMDPAKLDEAKQRLVRDAEGSGDSRYRVVIVRGGRLVAEWNSGVRSEEQLRMASATKSIFSSVLGIAIEDGRIESADSRLIDYYPEAMDVPEGTGPKPGRHVFPKNRDTTLRQLISNTSGYMKPGEEPGRVFHYQSFGMNVLIHATAKAYGLYDPSKPDESGYTRLIDDWLRGPIGATWGYYVMNFEHGPEARTNIFGYYDGVASTALDMARLGLLWLNWGRWEHTQVIPEAWLREATRTALNIVENCPREQWRYGYGFWTNDYGEDSANLPRDSYAAVGAGYQHIWVCPSLDLVVVQSPGLWASQEAKDSVLLEAIAEACA
jgi:CubicO group peptidase (beta-lactamase class C family)